MVAEIVSVGTELLMGQIADTNAQYLGKKLPEWGVSHHFRQTVGDNVERLVGAIKLALSRSDIVVTIGGLGPTEDDLTRQGIAQALGVEMEFVPDYAEKLRKLFEFRKLPWVDALERQAFRPVGAILIANDNGTAPGLFCRTDGKLLIALPGPRGEFVPMVDGPVGREICRLCNHSTVIHSRILKVCGMGESQVEARLHDLVAKSNPTVAPYAKPGEVHLRLTASAPSVGEANALIDPVEGDIRRRLDWHVFGADDDSLESVCLSLLAQRSLRLATAESLTGGGVGARITDVPGSSAAYVGGIVAYTPLIKESLLQVSSTLLRDHGPVSEPCARAMAEGGRAAIGADLCLSLTGNAGPETDVDGKPVGLVYMGLATPTGTLIEEHRFRGRREDVRIRSGQAALTMLYRWLVESKS